MKRCSGCGDDDGDGWVIHIRYMTTWVYVLDAEQWLLTPHKDEAQRFTDEKVAKRIAKCWPYSTRVTR